MIRKALITGGATGIGYAIATAMAGTGYHVTVTGLTDEQVARGVTGPHLTAAKLDVTSTASAVAVLDSFDRLDALVNCAGMIVRNYGEYDIDIFQKVIDVNLTGPIRMGVAPRAQ